jgi:hypothetical protein
VSASSGTGGTGTYVDCDVEEGADEKDEDCDADCTSAKNIPGMVLMPERCRRSYNLYIAGSAYMALLSCDAETWAHLLKLRDVRLHPFCPLRGASLRRNGGVLQRVLYRWPGPCLSVRSHLAKIYYPNGCWPHLQSVEPYRERGLTGPRHRRFGVFGGRRGFRRLERSLFEQRKRQYDASSFTREPRGIDMVSGRPLNFSSAAGLSLFLSG